MIFFIGYGGGGSLGVTLCASWRCIIYYNLIFFSIYRFFQNTWSCKPDGKSSPRGEKWQKEADNYVSRELWEGICIHIGQT